MISAKGGDSDEVVFDTASFARIPGTSLVRLSTFFENRLPQDFADCYRKYAEALVVARSCPMHLLSESKILAEAAQAWPWGTERSR